MLMVHGNQYGFSTLEIMIAFVVILSAITAAMLLVFGNQTLAVDGSTSSDALLLAEKQLRGVYEIAQQDFNLIVPKSPGADGLYTVSLQVQSIDRYTKQVTSIAAWQRDMRSESVRLTALATNWRGGDAADTCNSVISGDWKNPQVVSYSFGADILGDTVNNFPVTSLDAKDGKLYASIGDTATAGSADLFVLDISHPSVKPALMASVDNSPTVKTGLNAIVVAGQYAYTASAYGANFTTCTQGPACAQMQIFDISVNPPQLKVNFKVPGVLGKSGQAIGQSIFYRDGYVYLGLAKTAGGPEFNIIDVHDPLHPLYAGGYAVGSGVNAVIVKNGFAYVASPNDEELLILQVVNPAAPVRVNGFNAPGGSGNGKSLALVGSNLFLGRTLGGNELYVLNVAQPSSFGTLGAKDLGNDSLNGLVIRDYLAFLITNTQLQIVRTDNLVNIVQYSNPVSLPGNKGTAIDCEGNFLYIGSVPGTNKGFLSVVTAL